MVFVTVTNVVRSKDFKVETTAGLMPPVQMEFGEGTVSDPNGVALTAEYEWQTGGGRVHLEF